MNSIHCIYTSCTHILIEIECSTRYPDKYQLERFRDNPGDKSKHGARSRKRFILHRFSPSATNVILALLHVTGLKGMWTPHCGDK